MKIGDEIKSKYGIAVVKDKYEQTDINKIPYMSKTEFAVTDIETNSTQKAVLHTYYTQTFLMIQGKGVMQNKSYCRKLIWKKGRNKNCRRKQKI